MARTKLSVRLDDRCYSIVESFRDRELEPSFNAALNKLILTYSRLEEENSRLRHQSATKVPPKVDAAKA